MNQFENLCNHPNRKSELFWKKVDKKSSKNGCWLWIGGKISAGYGIFNLGGIPSLAHRISFQSSGGKLSAEKPFVLHDCPNGDNKACVNPAHLWAGSHADNMRDKELKGCGNHAIGKNNGRYTMPERTARGDRHYSKTNPSKVTRGEAVGLSKLKNEDIPKIREIYKNGGTSFVKLGLKFGVSRTAIGRILNGKSWSHV